MTIAFVHNNKAFLPELQAYTVFFSKFNIRCESVTSEELKKIKPDIEWFIMGMDSSKKKDKIIRIHEYISSSTPPYRILKDRIKKFVNTRPDLRIYQNEFVKNAFHFSDKIPFLFRDGGFEQGWLSGTYSDNKKEYDFIYVGSLSPTRKPHLLLSQFLKHPLKDHTIMLLGDASQDLKERYAGHSNILFKGPVGKDEVSGYIRKSRFGINFIPAEKPFTELPSTKFLEYAACDIPIISTDYNWVRKFQEQAGGAYFYLNNDLSNFTWQEIVNFHYSSPDLKSWSWDEQIRKSGILDFLNIRFPGMGIV